MRRSRRNLPRRGRRTDVPPLPPELWEVIFRNLPNRHLLCVRRTCRQWRDIVDGSSRLTRYLVAQIEVKTPVNRRFNPRCWYPAPELLIRSATIVALPERWWAEASKNLRLVILYRCRVPFTTFLRMVQDAPNLEHLNLQSIVLENAAAVVAEDFQLDRVLRLDLMGIDGSALDEMLVVFGNVLTGLKSFHLDEPLFGEPQIASMVNFIRKVRPSLETITLSADGIIRTLCDLDGLQLRDFAFRGSGNEPGVLELLLKSSTLQTVLLIETGLTIENLCEIGRNLPHLRSLAVLVVVEVEPVVPTFLTTMPGLHELVLLFDKVLDDFEPAVGFRQIGSPNLKLLMIEGACILPQSLRQYLRNSPNIQSVSLRRCECSNWPDLFDMISHLDHVRHFSLTEVIAAKYNDHFRTTYENLQTLSLSGCDFTSSELKALFKRCPNLAELKIHEFHPHNSFNDEALRVLCRNKKHLRKLTLNECCKISENSARQIISQFYPPKLVTTEWMPTYEDGLIVGFVVYLHPIYVQ